MAAPWSVCVDFASWSSSLKNRYTRLGNTVAMYSASGIRGFRLGYFSPGLGAEKVRENCHSAPPHDGHFCGARESQCSSARIASPFLVRVTVAPHDGQSGTFAVRIRSPAMFSGRGSPYAQRGVRTIRHWTAGCQPSPNFASSRGMMPILRVSGRFASMNARVSSTVLSTFAYTRTPTDFPIISISRCHFPVRCGGLITITTWSGFMCGRKMMARVAPRAVLPTPGSPTMITPLRCCKAV